MTENEACLYERGSVLMRPVQEAPSREHCRGEIRNGRHPTSVRTMRSPEG
jgi:hypothetical protein